MGLYDEITANPALADEVRRAQTKTDYRSQLNENKNTPAKGRKKTMPRRSNKELAALSERKWKDLTQAERKSVRAWMRKRHDDDTALDLDAADLLEHNQHISIAKAYAITATVASADDAHPRPEEENTPAHPDTDTTAQETAATVTADRLQALADETGIEWLDEWPEQTPTTPRPTGRWQKIAAALRETGKPAVIATGMTRKRAREIARTINRGATSTWQPRGAWKAGARGDDRMQVIAQWIGERA